VEDISGLLINGELLYESTDIDRYYTQFVVDSDKANDRDSLALVSNDMVKSLGCTTLFDMRRDDHREKDVMAKLIGICKPYFEGVKEISVAKKFFDKYPNEQLALMALRNVFSSAEVFMNFKQIPDFVRLPNSKVSLVGIFGGREGSLPEFRDMVPLLEKCCSEPGQLRGIQPIRGKNEILFTTEEGAFPLRMLNEIDKYEAKYDQLMEGLQNPLHLRRGEQDYLAEINMPSQEEQKKARIAVLIGIALNIISTDPDDPQIMVYSYTDRRTGLKEFKPIGKKDQEEKILESMLARFNRELRETIYQDVIRKVTSCGRDMKLRETVWKSISNYRDEFLKKRDKEYIEEKGFGTVFSSVIGDYNLYDPSFTTQ